MRGYWKICNAAYWLGLMCWFAALTTAGIAAAFTFARLKHLGIEIERYPALPIELHGRLAAGIVMEGVFFTADIIQFVAIPVVVIALLLQLVVFKMRWASVANVIRIGCILGAAGLFAYHATSVAPAMNRELRTYWDAAESGDSETALRHQQAFHKWHPTAELVLQVSFILLVIGAIASAAAFTPQVRNETHLQEPALRNRP